MDETEYFVRQFLSFLYQVAVDSNQKVTMEEISKLYPPDEIDRMRRTNDLYEIRRFLRNLETFLKEKEQEARSRGVKSLYSR